MEFKKDCVYIILVNVGRILTYEGIIIEEDSDFLKFLDKYNKEYSYNKNSIVSIVEKEKLQ